MSKPYKPEELRPLGDLEPRSYYVVKVSFRKGNSKHRAIMWHHHDGFATLLSGSYEHPYQIKFQTFYAIEVVEKISAMNPEVIYK